MVENTELPKEVVDKALQLVEIAKNAGKIKKGINETTKSIERGEAKLVLIAGDVEPKEIVMHIPAICGEKKIPFMYIPNKRELGRAAGLDVPSAAIAVEDVEDGKDLLKEVLSNLG